MKQREWVGWRKKRCTSEWEQRAQWEVVEVTVEVVGGWKDVDGWMGDEV